MQQTQPRFRLTHTVAVTLVRRGAGSYVNGVWTLASDTTSTIQANVQPVRGHELVSLPEADRSREWIKVYTVGNVRGTQEGSLGGTSPDILIFDGRTFEVKQVSTYKMGVLDHSKILAGRIPESAGE
jgi:hypothetical protein